MKRVYNVTASIPMMVVATSAREARQIAAREAQRETVPPSLVRVVRGNKIAESWDAKCLPYGDHENRTVGDWMEDAKDGQEPTAQLKVG